MSAEKRSLKRVSNRYGFELTSTAEIDSIQVTLKVVDFNALGVLVSFTENLPRTCEYLDYLEIKYGREVICSIRNPKVLRINEREKTAVISLQETKKVGHSDRNNRVSFGTTLQGILWGTDPLSVDHRLYFRVADLSREGFRIVSSKSNGHLTPGMEFQDYSLQIPGYKNQKISFQITNVRDTGSELSFGCRITKKSKTYERQFIKLQVVAGNVKDQNQSELRENVRKTKKFIGDVRLTTVRTKEEYQEVLDLRFKAYRAANKVTDDQTAGDMADPFDDHSFIMTAYVGSNLVGTMRIVMKEPGKPLPCEKHFDLSTIKEIEPDRCAEVSRFAIDPIFQGTDLFVAISRKLVVELTVKKIQYPLCLATQKLAPSYQGLGAKKLTGSIPHPTLAEETLTLYWLVPNAVHTGQTGSLSWIFVIKPSLKFLKKMGFVKSVPLGISHYFLFIRDIIQMKLRKKKK